MIPLKDTIKSRTYPLFNTLLILINLGVFIYELTLKSNSQAFELFFSKYGFIPAQFMENPSLYWYTIITSLFLHAGFLHFIGNMLFLFIFGDNIEDGMGHFRYLFFYLITGIGAHLIQYYFSETGRSVVNIGASGAISAVLGAYMVLYPLSKIITLVPLGIFFFNIKLPAYLFLGLWALIQFFSIKMLSKTVQTNVAYYAHFGGFALGFVYALLNRNKFLKKYKEELNQNQD